MTFEKIKRPVLFSTWLAVFFFLLSKHTPWRDEYQSFLIATRTATFSEFADVIRYERSPPLQPLIQYAVYSLNLEWFTAHAHFAIELLTVPFTIGSVALILFALDLSFAQAALLIFSSVVLREYGVISRSYSIGMFLILLAAFFLQRKRIGPALFCVTLCAGTHALFFVTSAMFAALIIRDSWSKREHRLAFYLTGFGFFLWTISQIPPADTTYPKYLPFGFTGLIETFKYLNQTFFNFEALRGSFEWMDANHLFEHGYALVALPIALILVYRQLRIGAALALMIPALFVAASLGDSETRYLGVAFFGLIMASLFFRKANIPAKKVSALTIFLFPMTLSSALWIYKWSPWKQPPDFDFSDTHEMILNAPKEMLEPKAQLLVQTEFYFFTWMAETNKNIFSTHYNRVYRYTKLAWAGRSYETINEWCPGNLAEFKKSAEGPLFIGLKKGTPTPLACGPLKKVYSTQRSIATDESFDIYRL